MNLLNTILKKKMISPPPTFNDIKIGINSSIKFMSKKGSIKNLFELNNKKFWESCWIIFFVNALVSILASYGIRSSFEISLKANLLPKLMLITIIDITLFSILIFFIFEKINKKHLFFSYIIPFNWIQAVQAFIMLGFTFFGLIIPVSIFLFFGFFLVIWVTYSLWRIGKDEIKLNGLGSAGLIILSVVTEGGIGLLSRSLSTFLY